MQANHIQSKENLQFQKWIVGVGILLFVIKLLAWQLTSSVAILTDALESTINVIAGLFGLYSLYLSSLPKDQNHPYGHGKIEFISASVEGVLICFAGLVIVYEAVMRMNHPTQIQQLDYGIFLVFSTALINYFLGYYAVKKGKKNHSLALISSGKHLQTDTYSTFGIILGLMILYILEVAWIDSAIALIFAGFILYTGYKIIKESVSGIMDEADEVLIEELVLFLNENRKQEWIDIHNLRIIKYGATLHIDCHMTLPWYYNLIEGHKEVDALEELLQNHFGNRVEVFVHIDPCVPDACEICQKKDCFYRQKEQKEIISWTLQNVSTNQKHRK